jgi:hypothetical protein
MRQSLLGILSAFRGTGARQAGDRRTRHRQILKTRGGEPARKPLGWLPAAMSVQELVSS